MRVRNVSMLAAAVAAVGLAMSAAAAPTVYDFFGTTPGPVSFTLKALSEGNSYKYSSGAVYTDTGNPLNANDINNSANILAPSLNAIPPSEDSWGIFRVTGIQVNGNTTYSGIPAQIYGAGAPSASGYSLYGIYYGVRDTKVTNSTGALLSQTIESDSMKIAVYAVPNSTVFDLGTAGRLTANTYNWAGAIATPVIQIDTIPLNNLTTTTFQVDLGFSTTPTAGNPFPLNTLNGVAMGKLNGGGTWDSFFSNTIDYSVPKIPVTLHWSLEGQNNITQPTATPFAVEVSDPGSFAQFNGVPTPSGVWAGALLLCGVVARRVRRSL